MNARLTRVSGSGGDIGLHSLSGEDVTTTRETGLDSMVWVTLLLGLWLCGGQQVILPSHGGSGIELPQNLLAWSAVALIVVVLCGLALRSPPVMLRMPAGTRLLLTGAVLWSLPLLWSPHPDWQLNALPRVLALWGLVALYMMLLRACPGLTARRHWLVLIVVAAVLQAGTALIQLAHPHELTGGRLYGAFLQPNVLSSFLATGLACTLLLFLLTPDRRVRLLTGPALVLLPAVLVLTQSRAGWLGAILAVVILLWSARQAFWRLPLGLILAGTAVGVVMVCVLPHLFPGMGWLPVNKQGSNSARLYMLRLTWQLIEAHPFTGNGYGGFEALFGQLAQTNFPGLERETVTHPHNELLLAWLEGGLPALAGLLLMIVAVLRRLFGQGGAALTGLALLLPIAVHMNLEYPLYQSVTHGITLVLLLVISGPDPIAPSVSSVYFLSDTSRHDARGFRTHLVSRLARMTPALRRRALCLAVTTLLSLGVLVFMQSGLVAQQRLMQLERAGLMPLASNTDAALAWLPNPYAVAGRLDFDRHVALLLRYNLTGDPALLTAFRVWGEQWLTTHNDPSVYDSLLRITRAQHRPEVEELCRQAQGRWPYDPRFAGCGPGSASSVGGG